MRFSYEQETYEVVVGNIGTVWAGDDESDAREAFAEYVTQSRRMYGRAAGESVTLFAEGEPLAEHHGDLDVTA